MCLSHLADGRIRHDSSRVDERARFRDDRLVGLLFVDVDPDSAVLTGRHAAPVGPAERDRNDRVHVTEKHGNADADG